MSSIALGPGKVLFLHLSTQFCQFHKQSQKRCSALDVSIFSSSYEECCSLRRWQDSLRTTPSWRESPWVNEDLLLNKTLKWNFQKIPAERARSLMYKMGFHTQTGKKWS